MRGVVEVAVGDQRSKAQRAELRVLDVGCGTGVLCGFLQETGVAPGCVYGLDLSEQMILRARERYPLSTWLQADFLGKVPAELLSSFDAIVFNECLHHFTREEQRAALTCVTALLR
jgi:2-polyprenyl-3-methyl-5-hydroxy-6-metoxy-1,4-benzoquinol methylase